MCSSQLKFEPLRDESIKTISSSKQEVVCNAVLPLSDGGTLNIDYSFFWQGNTADMRYSISRKPAQRSRPRRRRRRRDRLRSVADVSASNAQLATTTTRRAVCRQESRDRNPHDALDLLAGSARGRS